MHRFSRPSGNDSLEDLQQTATNNFLIMQTLRSYLVIVFSIGVALGAGLNSGMNSVSTDPYRLPRNRPPSVTRAEYEQIVLQMPLESVEAILGQGIEVGRSDSIVILEWKNIDDSSMTLFFEYGYLVQKAQVGLM